jgi:hypothetical protein
VVIEVVNQTGSKTFKPSNQSNLQSQGIKVVLEMQNFSISGGVLFPVFRRYYIV